MVQDGPDDPRVGVTGGSYGGALSLLLAGTDKRVDALAPAITYNDLSQALLPNSATTGAAAGHPGGQRVRRRTACSSGPGRASSSPPASGGAGLADPSTDAIEPGSEDDDADAPANAGRRTGRRGARRAGSPPAVPAGSAGLAATRAAGSARTSASPTREVATTGQASQKTVDLLRSVSPVTVTDKITQPTLLVQGEQDTLFGLDQADATARQIAEAGGEVKVVWYTGGHDGGKPGPELRGEIADWFDFHLRDQGADPGTGLRVRRAGRACGCRARRRCGRSSTAAYPGLDGTTTDRRRVRVYGPEQTIINPPGGNPASISSMPGLGAVIGSSSRLAGRVAIDLPGQSARFTSRPLTSQLLIAGVEHRAAARVGGAGRTRARGRRGAVREAVRRRPGRHPDRCPARRSRRCGSRRCPPTGAPVEVTVTLPGIVRPVETDRRIELVVTHHRPGVRDAGAGGRVPGVDRAGRRRSTRRSCPARGRTPARRRRR